jgi:hypothetical protein
LSDPSEKKGYIETSGKYYSPGVKTPNFQQRPDPASPAMRGQARGQDKSRELKPDLFYTREAETSPNNSRGIYSPDERTFSEVSYLYFSPSKRKKHNRLGYPHF